MTKWLPPSDLLKKLILLLVPFLLLFSCNKESLNYAKNALLQNEWYQSEAHVITYRAIENDPYTILRDTAYALDPCWKNSKYDFQQGGVVKFTQACFVTPISYEGKWEIDDDRYLLVQIPMQVNGQTLIFGIDGIITEIDKKRFVTKSTKIFAFTSCSNTAPCVNIRDSTVNISTYRN